MCIPVGRCRRMGIASSRIRTRDSTRWESRATAARRPFSWIKALIEAWADAVRRHDLPAILAHYDDDIVMFDVPPPLQSRGMAAYKKTWDLFFAYHQPGQAFDVEELQMCVGDTVAFAVAIMRCGSATVSGPPVPGGFQFRLTTGLCRVDGAWWIKHEHHSVPATD